MSIVITENKSEILNSKLKKLIGNAIIMTEEEFSDFVIGMFESKTNDIKVLNFINKREISREEVNS